MNRRPLLALLATIGLASLLGGCAGMERGPAPMPRESPEVVEAEAEITPDEATASFSPELLYTILVAEFAGQRQQVPLAVDAYLAAARIASDPRIAERAARIALFADNDPAAREAAAIWVRLSPSNQQARQIMAALHIRAGEVDEAVVQLEALVDLVGSESADGFMAIGGMLSRENEQRTALAVMARLVEGRQDNADALFAQAHMAQRLGEYELAAEALERVLALRPDWTQALILQAGLQRHHGGPAAALPQLEAAVEDYPDDWTLRMTYAQYLVDAERLEQARELFDELSRERPDDTEVRFALGLLGLQMGEPEMAENHMRHLVERDEGGYNAVYFLGLAMEEQGQLAEAERWLRRVDGGQYRFNAHLQVGRIMAERGEVVEARHFLRSIEPTGEDERIRLILTEGRILMRFGHYHAAFDVYGEGLEALPGQVDMLYARAMVAERLGHLDVLEADLKQILEDDPDHVHALNALGYTLVDRTERREEGMEYIRRAHALDSEDPAVLDSMGWGHFRLGNLEQAEMYLRRAYQAHPDSEVGAHLGEVLWQRGKTAEARAVWDDALELDPDDDILRETMRRLLP